jgi:PPM family protein phosphatase
VDVPKVTAHGRSDVGRVRTGNEDALLIGHSIFAVADGMGGHRGGEVASAAALEPLRALDGQQFPTPEAAMDALTEAVVSANATVARRSQVEPELAGMGTTLTAVLVDGRDAHLVHVGDSRAYLARGDSFVQLTDDHTLVQALIDQGRITRDQVATHPHRSVITRAVGVADDVEVDGLRLTLRDGDRLVLCSDGLSGVVDDDTIARTLQAHGPEEAPARLIEAANAAGGPDNITVLVMAVDSGSDPDATAKLPRTIRIRTDEPSTDRSDWAARISDLGDRSAAAGARSGSRSTSSSTAPPRPKLLGGTFDRVALKLVIAAVTIVLLVTGIALGARLIIDRAYLVGVADEEIVIFRGFDVQLGPVDLLRVHERTGVTLDRIQPALRPVYEAGRPAADLGDARRIVRNIPLVEGAG